MMTKTIRFIALHILAVLVSGEISDKEYALMPILNLMDDFDRCLMYGKDHYYCYLKIQLYPKTPENPSRIWKIIEKVNSDESNYRHDMLKRFVCVPEVCPNVSFTLYKDDKVRQKLEVYYNDKFEHMGLRGDIKEMTCEGPRVHNYLETYTLLYGIVLLVYASLLIYLTLYDIFAGCNAKISKTTMVRLSAAVSVRKNWQRLMTVDLTTPDMMAFRCMQGVRFYNLVYAILCHGTMRFLTMPTSNVYFMEKSYKAASMMYDVSYPMQIFFMLSGFLICYQFLLDVEKGIKISLKLVVEAFIKRYIRLTPVFVFSIFFSCTFMKHLSNGPSWPFIIDPIANQCRIIWWTNLLYINNMFSLDKQCYRHTWYLAVNTQLFVLSHLLLWVMSKYPKKQIHIFATVLLGNIICSFVAISRSNFYHMLTLQSPQDFLTEGAFTDSSFRVLHIGLYANAPAIMVGMIMAYIYFKHRNKQLFTRKVHVVFWWIVSFGLPLVLIYIDSTVKFENLFYIALYGSIKKGLFACGLGLMVLGMTQGQGWFLRWICETSPIYVLGKLTYSTYIVHMHLHLVLMAPERRPTFLSLHNYIYLPIGDVVFSFTIGLFLTLFVEMPMMEIHKLYRSQKSETKSKNLSVAN